MRDIVSVEGLSVIQAASPARAEAESLDLDLVRTDGTRLPARLLHRVPVAPDGTVGASRTLVLDMRLGNEPEAGRIAEMRFARFFNNTPMAIASVDRQGRIALTNARFVMLFGKVGPVDGRGRRLGELVQESDRAGGVGGDRRGDRGPERHSRRRRRLRRRAGAQRALLRQPHPGGQ